MAATTVYATATKLYSADLNQTSVHRVTSTTNRDLLYPTPVAGNIVFLINTGLQMYSGSAWVTALNTSGIPPTQAPADALNAPLASPTFTGTVRSPNLKATGMVESNSDSWSGFAFYKGDGTSMKGQIVTDTTVGMQIDYNTLNTGTPLIFRSYYVEQARFDSGGTLTFGSARDTNLYRTGADTLRTDDSMQVGGGLTITGNVLAATDNSSKLLFGSLGDTNLYRSAADTLKTDDTLLVAGAGGVQVTAGMVVASNNTGQMYFGSALDTNLYRSAADTLKTDDKFIAVAGLGVGNSAAASVIPTANLVKKIQVFDSAGAALGYVPVYSSIT